MGKYFGTDGFRGEAGITLTADHAYKVGRFLGWYYNALRERNGDTDSARIVIGKDGCLGDAGPFTVFLAELRKHVRLLAFIVAFTAVLLPQQGQGNAVLCQLTVNVRIVRFNVQANTLVLVREEHPLHRHW